MGYILDKILTPESQIRFLNRRNEKIENKISNLDPHFDKSKISKLEKKINHNNQDIEIAFAKLPEHKTINNNINFNNHYYFNKNKNKKRK